MEKEKFDKNLTKLVDIMIEMGYSRYTVEQTLLWLIAVPEEKMIDAILKIISKLEDNPDEEDFDIWMSQYGDKIRKRLTKEEKERILKERAKRNKDK